MRSSLVRRGAAPALVIIAAALTNHSTSSAVTTGTSLVRGTPNDAVRVALRGNLHPLALPQFDTGAVSPAQPLAELKLILRRSQSQETALQKLLADQQDHASPRYHKWITADEFGTQFGATDQDLKVATTWLESHAFKVGAVPAGRGYLPFTGSAAQVEAAFQTPIHSFTVNGLKHFANTANPEIPIALQPLVGGIRGLHDFRARPDSKSRTVAAPDYAAGGGNYVVPGDYATIYSYIPLFENDVTGKGETIVIAAQSDIDIAIPQTYWSAYGVLFGQHVTSIAAATATDPGRTGDGNESEAYLDVEIAGALAPEATILVVRDKDVGTAFEYAINHNLGSVINISFSNCEKDLGSANASIQSAFQQAAAEGITVVVSSGDNGIAECDVTNTSGQTVTSGFSVNGFATTPYNLAVGGTDFNPQLEQQGSYWNTSNNTPIYSNAKSYIPEMAWNYSCGNPVTASVKGAANPLALCNNPNYASSLLRVSGSGGGVSGCISVSSSGACSAGYPAPSWQSGVNGMQGITTRTIPDVSMLANDWVACDQALSTCGPGHPLEIFSGTSAAAPAIAALVALLDEVEITQSNADGRQGNLAPTLYRLGAQQYGSPSSPNSANLTSCNANNGAAVPDTCAFNDVTVGSNAQPCKLSTYAAANSRPLSTCSSSSGYTYGIVAVPSSSAFAFDATPGFDLASGLGSVNASIIVEWIAGIETPTNLLVSGSGTTASLTWTGLNAATSYNIYVGTYSGGEADAPIVRAVKGTSATVTGLQAGEDYYFYVTANVSTGETYPSTEQTLVLVPAAPQGLHAAGTSSTITLSWNSSEDADTYNVLQGSTAGAEASTPIASGVRGTSYSLAGTSGKSLYFKVVAVNQGGQSAASNEVVGNVLPQTPTGLTASGGSGSVSLSWKAGVGASSYNVYQGTSTGAESHDAVLTGVTATSANVSGLTNATTYYFYVTSVNSAGSSGASNETNATASASGGKSGGGSLRILDLMVIGGLLLSRYCSPILASGWRDKRVRKVTHSRLLL